MRQLLGTVFDYLNKLRHGVATSNSRLKSECNRVAQYSAVMSGLTDDELLDKLTELRTRIAAGTSLPAVKSEALAIIREAADRTLQLRPYDVQIQAAIALNDCQCVEMQTGEGKTLVAVIVACLRSMAGQDVHILTFNDYLAERDAAWMKPLYEFFGLTVGHVNQSMNPEDRRKSYRCDVTYVTAREAGFDYLRDQLCYSADVAVHRDFPFAIVDEADSILIDEARIPLVIATEADRDEVDLQQIASLIRTLRRGIHFEVKAGGRNISFTESGLHLLERQLGIVELHSEESSHILSRLNQALHAEHLLSRDTDYIVRDDQLELIDEFTGRVADNRKWPGGLQAALEAKEGVPVQPEGRIVNSITLQNFVDLYDALAGMTGTAVAAAEEFGEFYGLQVTVIPPNQPCVRIDQKEQIFSTRSEKYEALVEDISVQHHRGRPILVGTCSVDESEALAQRLVASAIPCKVLNAANDHLEAEIIAEAGAAGAVTISTNMAGRGTDIRLGGSHGEPRGTVVHAGGLYVIGTNRHESRRIDNQLRGRAGRQGDPGESKFFISLQDPLLVQHGVADLVQDSDPELEPGGAAQKIAHLQRVIEGESFEIRRTLRMYSHLLEIQRKRISEIRARLLAGSFHPCVLKTHATELFERLVEQWGEELVLQSERKATLVHLDWCWSDHLAHAGEIREGIHLVSLGGFNAMDVFNKEMNREFGVFQRELDARVVETLSNATFTAKGIDLEEIGLSGPSSTWTFMINDNPRGAVLNQLLRGITSRLRKAFR